jgi:hypothetical protein
MVELKYTPIQDFRIAGVPGLDDRNSAGFDSLFFDLRKRLLDRERSGIGVTVSVEPFWSRRDGIAAASACSFSNYASSIASVRPFSHRRALAVPGASRVLELG